MFGRDRMRFRRKKKKEDEIDPVTKRLLEQGVIRINPPAGAQQETLGYKIKEFGTVTYDFWSGVKYIIVLYALLLWLPLFGPMLAGYVGGRRTGGPKKGLLAAIVGLALIIVVYYTITHALFPESVSGALTVSGTIIAAVSNIDFMAPYVNFMELYWQSFFAAIIEGLPFSPNSYVLTAIFAYIGGIISVDKEREILRAEHKESPNIMINLPWMTAYQPTPVTTGAVRTNPEARRAAFNSRRRLQDMKKVQLTSQKKQVENKRANKNDAPKGPSFFESQLPKRPVKHHSTSDGDDWEIL